MNEANASGPPVPPPLDPSAAPRPVRRIALADLGLFGLTGLSCVTATGAFLLLASGTTGAARGATRSYQLQWEQRQTEMREAIERERAGTPAASPESHG